MEQKCHCFFFLLLLYAISQVERFVPPMSKLHVHVHVHACGMAAYIVYVHVHVDMNGRICGALLQFGCYQHRHKQMCKAPSILG